jgi:signal transduction histidine kinase
MPASESLYERLRILAIEDPKRARELFLEAYAAHDPSMEDLFVQLRRPNHGRVRQLIANALRTHPERARAVSELSAWQQTETDEFTRRAIAATLAGADAPGPRRTRVIRASPLPSDVIDMYRYVAGRLRHRLRNTMLTAQAQAGRLRGHGVVATDPDFQIALAKVNDALLSLGRELEATDVDPAYFEQRQVVLADWLKQLNVKYTSRYSAVTLTITDAEHAHIRVFASEYLLETIFWNIWLNAQQATPVNCAISITFQVSDKRLILQIVDNGPGFSRELKDIAFQQMYSSSKDKGRGRGLLEIQDAVERLAGEIRLVEMQSYYRIEIQLPLEMR